MRILKPLFLWFWDFGTCLEAAPVRASGAVQSPMTYDLFRFPGCQCCPWNFIDQQGQSSSWNKNPGGVFFKYVFDPTPHASSTKRTHATIAKTHAWQWHAKIIYYHKKRMTRKWSFWVTLFEQMTWKWLPDPKSGSFPIFPRFVFRKPTGPILEILIISLWFSLISYWPRFEILIPKIRHFFVWCFIVLM